MNTPDFECSIVSTGPVGSETDDNLASSGLYALDVTVEQVVYVTANRTLSLSEVSGIVINGFNRGLGGRNRFRSLLQADSVFSTVENVEVLEGALTRFPTSPPTKTKAPTGIPSLMPSELFTSTPSASPTTPVLPNQQPTGSPTSKATLEPTSQAPVSTEFPTDNPPTLASTTISPGNSANTEELGVNSGNNGRLITGFLVAGGSLMFCIFAVLFIFFCVRKRLTHSENQQKGRLNASTQAPPDRDQTGHFRKNKIPNHLVLNDDNQSLANTTLGDQTAGGLVRKYPPPFKQRQLAVKTRTGNVEQGQVGIPNSFDDNSLYTTHLAPPSLTETGETESSKATSNSNDQSNFSNSNSSFMLPPSVLPFDDEEEENLFSGRDLDSVASSSFCSTIAESGAIDSSLLSDSVTSSYLEQSDVEHGKAVAVDKTLFTINQKDEEDEEDDEDDPFGVDLFANTGRGLTQKTKTNDEEKAKLESHALEKEANASSAFSPFATAGGSSLLKLKFDTDEDPSRYGGSMSSFRSTETDNVPSAASSTSSFTKKVENVLVFGVQAPPEAKYRQLPMPSSENEEEKREIDYETRDEEAGNEGLRDGARNPLVDLLADTTLLDRSTSPSSWHSWMITKEDPPGQTHKIAAPKSTVHEESKISSNNEIDLGPHPEHYGRQFKADKVGSSQPVGLQHFLPIPEDDPSNGSSISGRGNDTKGDTKIAYPRPEIISPTTSEFSSSSLKEDGTGILGVQPRQDAAALMIQDQASASSSSTGLSNPWLYDAVEQTLGQMSATADIESLSGRSDRSGRSQRSNASSKSRHSRKSNRSFNVPPTSGKYKGRGEGRIRSAAASIASYKSSHTTPPLGSSSLSRNLTRLERQLAALHEKQERLSYHQYQNPSPSVAGDQVTASSATLSSLGAKTRSTFSSKLTHTGANTIRRKQMRITVEVPPGKLDIVLSDRHDGRGSVIFQVREGSQMKGMLSPGDQLGTIRYAMSVWLFVCVLFFFFHPFPRLSVFLFEQSHITIILFAFLFPCIIIITTVQLQ